MEPREAGGRNAQEQTFAPPKVSLPTGGGAIRGIGEKLSTNPVTGGGALTVPLAISAGRSGSGPELALSYDSGTGNGPFGFGWRLAVPAITRKTDKGIPQYLDHEESDVFLLSGSEDLVPARVESGGSWVRDDSVRTVDSVTYRVQCYRPRIEGPFARIERWTASSGESHWRSISRGNITTLYGKTAASRIADPADPRRVFSWLICETWDDKGNATVYEYKREDSVGVDTALPHERNRTPALRAGNLHLKRVKYGNRVSRLVQPDLSAADWMFEVVLDYGDHDPANPTPTESRPWLCRHDPFSSCRSGFEVRTYRLCQRALMFHHFPAESGVGSNCLVRSTNFVYRDLRGNPDDLQKGHPVGAFLASITHCGYRRQSGGGYLKGTLPPLELEYSLPEVQDEVRELDPASLENLPIGLDGTGYQWVDLDGEGVSGILTEQGDAWFYKPNLGQGRFGPVQRVPQLPSLAALVQNRQQLLDLAGDGKLDLVLLSGYTPGFFERTQKGGWEDFTPFRSQARVDWDEPNLRFVDLDGDGHADVLITEQDVFAWHRSLGEEGFGPVRRVLLPRDEEKGPKLVFADGTQSIFIADMNGDGLADLVRIRNGEVCYWPSLGHGRFGPRVVMDGSPWFDIADQFDQRRIRLADIDGSGTSDVIYLSSDGVRLYFNQAGNSLSAPRPLRRFPAMDSLVAVQVVDLLGNGTACLVWSSTHPEHGRRSLRYVDLMGGRKPHLLVSMRNNLGTETRLQYAPSTRFYLEDKAAGRPWATRLPFPVHVVERIETYDWISRNRFVSRYAYHHGYFDGDEREFRGFALVEKWDTEELASLTASGAFPSGDNVDASSHVPPVLTRTWFHTGAFLEGPRLAEALALGYYREPGLTDAEFTAQLLADSRLPAGLDAEETRQAYRALKGSVLRRETFALDGSAEASRPYNSSEFTYTVRRLQPRAGDRFAVFLTHLQETLDVHTERTTGAPRTTHSLTLRVDPFGNVLESAAIAYGRRLADPALAPADQAVQARLLATYTESTFTQPVATPDAHRTPVACDVRTYELTGLALGSAQLRFSASDVRQAFLTATAIPYEQAPASGVVQKRLVEHVRTLFRRDDLAGSLPLGQQGELGLIFENYKLAFTPGLVTLVYGSRVSDIMLQDEGRFVHSEGDSNWWIPSGRHFFSPDDSHTAAQELAYARQHFFLPRRFRDPFLQTSTTTFDAYDLLPVETVDPLGNRTTVGERDAAGNIVTQGNDYRVLRARRVMDSNRNCSEVALDVLGMVVGSAVMGKPGEAVGDSLAGFVEDLPEATALAHLQNPLSSPDAILGQATTRIVYDLFAYHRTRSDPQPQPPVTYRLTRETHAADLSPGASSRILHTFAYADGFGREVQKKLQAEPGPVVSGGPDVAPRWVGSGWTVFNNKGKPVRQYESFFSDTHRFEFARIVGVSSVVFYDPIERAVGSLHANHAYEKTVYGPWDQELWDVSDTVLQADPATDAHVGGFFQRLPSTEYLPTWHAQRVGGALGAEEQSAAQKASAHAGTPVRAHYDCLGRVFLTVAQNRFEQGGVTVSPRYETRLWLDIEGNQRDVIDAKGRSVVRFQYDMLSNRVHQASMEAGENWMLNDVSGKPLYAWDSRGHRLRTRYDALRRPTDIFVQEGSGPEKLVQRMVYGESQPNPEASNLRGQVYQAFDGAGVVTNGYDFKGNPLRTERRFAVEYKQTLDWSGVVPLEAESFTTQTAYDALNRPVAVTTPDGSVVRHRYNEAALLERVEGQLGGSSTVTPFVEDIDYDARGKRSFIRYGNGAQTEYSYDPHTFRLVRLFTTRGAAFPGDCPDPTQPACGVQNLRYTYDPVGNITSYRDEAQQTVYFRNRRVEPSASFTFDAAYRLLRATGREHLGQSGSGTLGAPASHAHSDVPRVGLLHPGDGQAVGRYEEEFSYDELGNIQEVLHRGTDPAHPGWRRAYRYQAPSLLEPARFSNRLTSTQVDGESPVSYSHDAHGNITAMPHLPLMRWDHRDSLSATSGQAVSSGTPETTYYVYDSEGQRVRKVTERQASAGQTPTRRTEQRYLSGYEVRREYDGSGTTVTLERQTLHVMDDEQRVLLVETRTQGADGSPPQLLRYQIGNHVGSASLELDGLGQIISYEEYYPYGSTSYQAVRSQTEAPKRYRFVSKERDEESGLSYHGARYLAPWLGRWISPDPMFKEELSNAYVYGRCNPVVFFDPSGKDDESPGWNRFMGGLRVLGGAAQTVGGALVFIQIEIPVAAQVVGGVAVVHGVDDMMTGMRQLISGRTERTTTETVVTATAEGLGADRSTAEAIGTGVDIGLGFVNPAGPATSGPRLGMLVTHTGERVLVVTMEASRLGARATELANATNVAVGTGQVLQMSSSGGGGSTSSSSSSSSGPPPQSRPTTAPTTPTAPRPPRPPPRTPPTTGSAAATAPRVVYRHRAGNQQVVTGSGARWHLPAGTPTSRIPATDVVGDALQAAARSARARWNVSMLNANEAAAVQRARNAGEGWRANLLIAQARGRWVEAEVHAQFRQLQWSPTGADVLDPVTGLSYDIMSGTESNMALHGRRMASEFFRMVTF